MPLSLYDYRRDGFIFTAEESLLGIFENTGVASSWTLTFPSNTPGLDFSAVYDIKIIFYFDAYYSDDVESRVKAHLSTMEDLESRIHIDVKSTFPDDFFGLQTTGRVEAGINTFHFPYHQKNPVISDIYLQIMTDPSISPAR
jgi:hypothetical protein